jgi:hypothetical protein
MGRGGRGFPASQAQGRPSQRHTDLLEQLETDPDLAHELLEAASGSANHRAFGFFSLALWNSKWLKLGRSITRDHAWAVDTAASSSLSKNAGDFTTLDLDDPDVIEIQGIGNGTIRSEGKGAVNLRLKVLGLADYFYVTLREVY